MTLPIILASSSPRRQQLLKLTNIKFSTFAVDIDEAWYPNETPTDYIERMVQQKAKVAAQQLQVNDLVNNQVSNEDFERCLLITADTIGVLPHTQQVLLKPKDQQDAFIMWRQLSGRSHYIWTAVQLSVINILDGNIEYSMQILEKTQVTFIELNEAQMLAYWQTGEPVDKAGAYAIQGGAAAWVSSINGSYTNVVGLPLAQTLSAINEMQQNQMS